MAGLEQTKRAFFAQVLVTLICNGVPMEEALKQAAAAVAEWEKN